MTKLLILGAGVPTPANDRFGTAFLLDHEGECLLFDCGPATTLKLVRAGRWPLEVDHLFLTHHHFDHNADLPCFICCRWDQSIGKENPLHVYGPPPLADILDKLFGPGGAYRHDLDARINGPVSQMVFENRGGVLPRPDLRMEVRELSARETVDGAGWRVDTARAHHLEPHLESLAYRFETENGTLVILGDTGPCKTISDFLHGADVVVANCWDHQATMNANGEAPGQTGTHDAADFANQAGAKMLVLAHMGAAISAPGSIERAIADISARYDGTIVVGREGMTLDLF